MSKKGNRSESEVEQDLRDLVALLVEGPKTVDELAKIFEVNDRTIYRWIERLQSEGNQIARSGTGRPVTFQVFG